MANARETSNFRIRARRQLRWLRCCCHAHQFKAAESSISLAGLVAIIGGRFPRAAALIGSEAKFSIARIKLLGISSLLNLSFKLEL